MDQDISVIISISVARYARYLTLFGTPVMILGERVLELLIISKLNQVIRKVVAKIECVLRHSFV